MPAGRLIGDFNVLVVLIEFQDVKHSSSNVPARFDSSLFGQSPQAPSVHNYFIECSFGALKVSGNVTAFWSLSDYTMAEYGADGAGVDNRNGPVYRLVTEAVRKADPGFDFSRFDKNSDGYIDHLCVVHAGQGQESSMNSDCIWSHKWYDYDEPVVDGVVAGPYTMLSEFSPVGTFAHELAHDMGLPDLYDYGMDSSGAGAWDLMAAGSWADNGNTPVHMSAWCKMKLGWLIPRDLTGAQDNLSLPNVEQNASAYRIWIEPPYEYFLIENRQKVGWDEHLPGGGMLVWHIDERRKNNDDQQHRLVDLEEMDEGANGDSPVQPTDPWHDSQEGFNPYSVPGTSAYAGYNTAWYVYHIGPSGLIMSFSVKCVDVDMSVIKLDFSLFMPEKVAADIRAVVGNQGGKVQLDIPVNITISRGDVLFSQTTRIPSLAPGSSTAINWRWAPPKAGSYILTVRVDQEGDGVPFNDEKTAVLRATTLLFFDDVENGQGGWEARASVPLVPSIWHIVNRSDGYGDSFSPDHSWWCGFNTTGKYTRGTQFTYYYLESPIIDLTRVDAAALAFRLKYDISSGLPSGRLSDSAIVEGSANLGGTWTQLDSFSGSGVDWDLRMYDISGFTQSMFRFRFVLRSNFLMMGKGIYVDDLAVFVSGNVYDVALGLSPNMTLAPPGVNVYFNLSVNNAGNRQDTYDLSCEGPAALSVSMNRTSLTLGLFETGKVGIVARITGKAEAGKLLAFRLTAVSRGNFLVSSTATGGIVVRQVHGLSLECNASPVNAGPGAEALFPVNLTNLGNGRDPVKLSIGGQWASCAMLGASELTLEPWETALVEVRMAVPANATAGSELALCLTVRSPAGCSEHITLKVAVGRSSGAQLDALEQRRQARPGSTARFDISLRNLGNGREDFVLSSDAPNGWTISHDTAVPLGPYAQTRLSLEAAFPAGTDAGPHSFTLKAFSAGGVSAELVLTVDVVMPDIYIKDMGVSPELIDEGATSTIRITVGNSGNDNASTVTVVLFDNGKRAKFWDLGKLPPGYQETLTVTIRPGRGAHTLAAVASTPDREMSVTNNEDQVEGRVRASSSFIPGFGPVLLAAVFLALVLFRPATGSNKK
jgi:immune inhibitor A